MDSFGRLTNFQLEEVDPTIEVTRHAQGLLNQYGDIQEDFVSEASQIILEYEEDDMAKDAQMYTYRQTPIIDSPDGKYAFCLDHFPRVASDKPLIEIGFVALHIFKYDRYFDLDRAEQLVFRQETHVRGAAVLEGYDMRSVESPRIISKIAVGLSKLEQLLWASFVESPYSDINVYPESEMVNSLNAFLSEQED